MFHICSANNPELRFLTSYYQQRLTVYEQLEFSAHSHKQLLEIGQEASSLRKFILDCYEEGYESFYGQVVRPISALERLQQFMQRLLQFLGETSERALFHLYPEVVELPFLQSACFEGETVELNVLLESLESQAERPVDIHECFANSQQMQQWQAKTALILDEMRAFMVWTLQQFSQQPAGHVPIFLLRDTLFPYFGYVWLFRKGLLSEAPQPLLLSRTFLRVTQGDEKFYGTLIDTLYQALAEQPWDVADFSKRVSQLLQRDILPQSFQRETRAYLQRLAGSRPIFMIESGLHGTMPLWILSQCENQGTFLLYTTAPWLREIYRKNTFQYNYNYLRDIETSIAQNFLFQLHAIENQQILVNKTNQPHIEKLALYELHYFRRLLEESSIFS